MTGFTIDEATFRDAYSHTKVRGYVDYDGTWDDEKNSKEDIERTWIVYNYTLTPSEGGEKAIYRECSSEAEAISLVRILNTIFESFVTVEFEPDDDPNTEDVMTYEHQIVTWAYA